jgi:hypothetical protein
LRNRNRVDPRKPALAAVFLASESRKKLMLRVLPGVELVFATLLPTKELMTLDLPTLERPRNAISGRLGGGKCLTSLAANMNRVRTRIGW